jgi:hypothetical protein
MGIAVHAKLEIVLSWRRSDDAFDAGLAYDERSDAQDRRDYVDEPLDASALADLAVGDEDARVLGEVLLGVVPGTDPVDASAAGEGGSGHPDGAGQPFPVRLGAHSNPAVSRVRAAVRYRADGGLACQVPCHGGGVWPFAHTSDNVA